MIVINPTDKDISVSIKGSDYTVKANSELKGVKEADAQYWVNNLHQFLTITPESTPQPKKEVVEEKPVAKEKEVKKEVTKK